MVERSGHRQRERSSTTSPLTGITPGPDGWIPEARRALDDLAVARTLPEVEVRFGTARRLAEQVLGFPVSGGHATRRVIRAVGALLGHRLGPAVAAEALTWSASLTGAVDTATVETFLEFALEAPGTYRPWSLGNQSVLDQTLGPDRNPWTAQTLCDLWTRSRNHLHDPDLDYRRQDEPELTEEWGDLDEDLAQWLRQGTSADDFDATTLAGLSPDQQRQLVEAASPAEVERLARQEGLFSLDDWAVGVCLVQATRTTLANRACPPQLRDRVRYPYDPATLELAVRAGPEYCDASRLRRMLADLAEETFQSLVSTVPVQTVDTLRQLGLLSADALVTGRLRHLDLEDRRLCRAALGSAATPETLDIITEVALRHPQGGVVAALLDASPRGSVPPDHARQLVALGSPPVARAAMRHLPFDQLVPADLACAAACGDAWVAACPGLSAAERPPLPWDRLRPSPPSAPSVGTVVWYPEPLRRLEVADFPAAHRWRVTLPRTAEDIRHNGRVMRNCTATLIDDVLAGSLFLVIVHDPQGHRYNVAVVPRGDRYAIDQINSWRNGGIEPGWIRPAFLQRLNRPEVSTPWDDQVGPARHLTPKRDRRRSRARTARQRRR